MPARQRKFTDLPEIGAYVLAHAAGLAWGFFVTTAIFRSLYAQGHRNLMGLGILMSLAVMAAVLLLFLVLRKLMARATWASPRASLTDLPEIGAYVVAHGIGLVFSFAVSPAIYRSLATLGVRDLQPIAVAVSIVLSAVVLLLFLFLRRLMPAPAAPS